MSFVAWVSNTDTFILVHSPADTSFLKRHSQEVVFFDSWLPVKFRQDNAFYPCFLGRPISIMVTFVDRRIYYRKFHWHWIENIFILTMWPWKRWSFCCHSEAPFTYCQSQLKDSSGEFRELNVSPCRGVTEAWHIEMQTDVHLSPLSVFCLPLPYKICTVPLHFWY